jgi:hypothetical protein
MRQRRVAPLGRKAAEANVGDWPTIAAAGSRADSDRAAERLWSVMRTRPPEAGLSYLYRLVDAHLRPEPGHRRRPVVDELLAPPPTEQTPRALLRHDVDSWEGMEQWRQWEGKMDLAGVYLLRAPLPEGARLADGTVATYPTGPPDYDVEDASVGELVSAGRERGCEFGLHYGSAWPAVVRAECRRLRDALGLSGPLPASSHWIQSSGATLAALDELGVEHDLCLMDYESYAAETPPDQPRQPGFLTGTTHPHLLWEPRRRRWLKLLAVPGALEEVFVAGVCPTVPEPGDVERYLELFLRHRGVIVLLWHSERFDLVEHLERLVDRLRELQFTFVTTAELKVSPGSDAEGIADPRG